MLFVLCLMRFKANGFEFLCQKPMVWGCPIFKNIQMVDNHLPDMLVGWIVCTCPPSNQHDDPAMSLGILKVCVG
jgi:hypothetical protein